MHGSRRISGFVRIAPRNPRYFGRYTHRVESMAISCIVINPCTDSSCPDLFAELIRRRYGEAELAAIAGGNLPRVLREAGDVAGRLDADDRPSEASYADPAGETP